MAMRYNYLLTVLFCLLTIGLFAQQPDKRNIRVADTLTVQEKNNRYPVILRSELDSMIKQHNASQPQVLPQQPVREIVKEVTPTWIWLIITLSLLGIAGLLYLLFNIQKLFGKKMEEMKKMVQQAKFSAVTLKEGTPDTKAPKFSEKKMNALHTELDKLKKDNEELQRMIGSYENVKQQIIASYKIRNYPGYDKTKTEEELLLGLLRTEKSVAMYAYEHFLKPVIAIADANKNNPARVSGADQEKLVELLISLALLYTEYLYLRVNELSVGGNMVARIQGLSNGNRLDTILMKQLNTEHGSRALVLRLILDKMDIQKLSYPVFDETNLNLS